MSGPDIIAVEGDVLPAEGRDMSEKLVWDDFSARTQLIDGATEIDGIPEDDGGDREVETGGAVALVFEGVVADLAVPMEKQGAG